MAPHFICSRVAWGILTDQITSIPWLTLWRLLIRLEWSCWPPLCAHLLSWPRVHKSWPRHLPFCGWDTPNPSFSLPGKLYLPEFSMAGSILSPRSYLKGLLPRLSLTSHSKVTLTTPHHTHKHYFPSQNNIISHNDNKIFLNTLIRRGNSSLY